MSISLNRIIYSHARDKEATGESPAVMALTEGLSTQDGNLWRGLTSLQPMRGDTAAETRALGLFAGPGDRFVFAAAYMQDGSPRLPVYEYVLLERGTLTALAGNLQPLAALFRDPVEPDQLPAKLPRIELPDPISWTPEERRACLEALLENDPAQMPRALALLGAALHERGVLIYTFPGNAEARVRMTQGLMALLPSRVRPDLTFSTNRHEQTSTHARVVFSEHAVTSGRWTADWATQTFPPAEVQSSPYVQRLAALWNGDIDALLQQIDQMEAIADHIPSGKNMPATLAAIADRHLLDTRVRAGEDVPIEAIKTTLREAPPHGAIKEVYAERLLRHALEARDTDAAITAANLMDDDPALDERLSGLLDEALRAQPDAVYAFIRARLSANLDERWLARLRTAALASLHVAITDGDSETVVNWLRLLAREPASYGLSEMVHNGILAAQVRARTDPELAQGLIVLAVRRDSAAAETLTSDSELMAVLPNNLGRALRDHEGDPAALLQAHGIETLLAALARAARVKHPALFTPAAIEQTWGVYTGGQSVGAGVRQTAEQIINGWIGEGAAWLTAPALGTLLGLVLRDRRDDLFHQLLHPLAAREDFVTLLATAMHRSERSVSDTLALIAQIIAVGDLSQQAATNLYIALLDLWDWGRDRLLMMAQLARAIQQTPALEVPDDVLWQLLTVAADAKDELIARVVARRITSDLEAVEDDAALIESLQQLMEQIQWNSHTRGLLLTWWRGFARAQSLSRLQRLDKAFDGSRMLEELRGIVQSLIAFRRMLGKRALGQFAEDVRLTFSVLQLMAEAYDPSAKRTLGFDPATIRAEFDARLEELSPHDLKILANNLKELAQLIGEMGDNRSKASLMRRDDVDRQLMIGEQPPHSAVDALKWMSGYLSGMHEKPEAGDE